ncbi:WD40-repeat-containing domain protein, partial [Dimargaris cristalligena]
VALGTSDGRVIIYSPTQNAVVQELRGSHTKAVRGFVLSSCGSHGYSCGDDGLVVSWNMAKGAAMKSHSSPFPSLACIALSANGRYLAVAQTGIAIYRVEGLVPLRQISGHNERVNQMQFGPSSDELYSSSHRDRYINVWKVEQSDDQGQVTRSLTAPSDIAGFSVSADGWVLAHLSGGMAAVWRAETAEAKSQMVRQPDSIVTVRLVDDENVIQPIIDAQFDSSHTPSHPTLKVVRGSRMKLSFDVVSIYEPRTLALLPEVTLLRKHLDQTRGINPEKPTLKVQQTAQEAEQTLTGGSSLAGVGSGASAATTSVDPNADTRTIEERLRDLNTQQGRRDSTAAPAAPRASLSQLLIQGLKTHDETILTRVISRSVPAVVRETVILLPPQYVVPFLNELVHRFQGDSRHTAGYLVWIQAVLSYHTAYLISLPDLVVHLQALYETLDSRAAISPALNGLQGRLSLVTDQIHMQRSLREAAAAGGGGGNTLSGSSRQALADTPTRRGEASRVMAESDIKLQSRMDGAPLLDGEYDIEGPYPYLDSDDSDVAIDNLDDLQSDYSDDDDIFDENDEGDELNSEAEAEEDEDEAWQKTSASDNETSEKVLAVHGHTDDSMDEDDM